MDELIAAMERNGSLRSARIREAFRATDRMAFVPSEQSGEAYADHPLHIGYGQTVSQPSTVAFMLELLNVQEGDRVLDVGSGSGWTIALLAHLAGLSGSVLGLERVDELVAFGQGNLAKTMRPNARIERAGVELGAPKEAPFDRILVSAAARTLPRELITQLKEGGTMVLPVRESIWRVVRVEHQPIIDKYEGFVFVPLVLES